VIGKIDFINPLSTKQSMRMPSFSFSSVSSSSSPPTFKKMLEIGLKELSDIENKANQLSTDFALGKENISVHSVMIAMQKSLIALKATTEVTKRCLNAYQEIWNMHI
jgi:flagellar hook-basal body complex protein FliE